jgi:ArsR family transcriptional regulator
MELTVALDAFAALAQPTRLRVLRLLVEREPAGAPAGEIARLLDVPPNTMSTHLAHLGRAGLVSALRQGRSIVYRADLARVRDLAAYLVNDCCGGHPDLCGPLVATLISSPSSKTGVCNDC